MSIQPRKRDVSDTSTHARKNGVPPAPDLRRRVALTRAEAAASLGVSVDFLEEHIQPELRLIRRGRLVLVPVKELERWCERNAARTVDVA